MKGRIVILSGPSGVGKDAVLSAWMQADSRPVRVVTYTTRAPREGEVDGIDYKFLTEQEFRELASKGTFLEHKLVHGNWYATPIKEIEDYVNHGRFAVLKIDVQGAQEVKRLRPDAVSVFLLPPSMEELEIRLRKRGLDSESVIQERLSNAKVEIAAAHTYDLQVVNDNVERAAQQIIEWLD